MAGQIPTILPYFITQRMSLASTLAAGIQVPTGILHSSVSIRAVVYVTDMSQKSFQGLNIDPRLLLHPGLLVLYQASLQSNETSARPSGTTILLSQTKLPRFCRHLIHLIWIRHTSVSITPSALPRKSVSHGADEMSVSYLQMVDCHSFSHFFAASLKILKSSGEQGVLSSGHCNRCSIVCVSVPQLHEESPVWYLNLIKFALVRSTPDLSRLSVFHVGQDASLPGRRLSDG